MSNASKKSGGKKSAASIGTIIVAVIAVLVLRHFGILPSAGEDGANGPADESAEVARGDDAATPTRTPSTSAPSAPRTPRDDRGSASAPRSGGSTPGGGVRRSGTGGGAGAGGRIDGGTRGVTTVGRSTEITADDRAGNELIQQSVSRKQSDVFVASAAGRVTRLLADDLEGSKHQKFLVRLPNNLTVLISHNIDLAPRVPVAEGDTVRFRGEYEYNDRGGVVHWTHHNPNRNPRKPGGWIEVGGKRYQ
ncbi:MAG: DUF3465 domain-containing protein [Phycisphaerales bacterium]